jgi:exodeoxyribonuclease VII large subunit
LSKETRHIYTVSQLAQDIKLILESSFGQIWVEGEVSNFIAHSSGHFYFSLKDGANVLSAVMFSWANKDLRFKIDNGQKVICFGKISAYGPHSKYQITVERIEPQGIGSLQLALEQLKEKLAKEGLFAQEHKRQIPYLPSKIGIVTSLSGAAIRDMIKVLERRFSDAQIIISPAQVQGEGAKEQIAGAIRDLNLFNRQLSCGERIEVMIVGRGGGSNEDLWAFNEEIVARAIYSSQIPVISAVGHERDWTIADMVADLRAATPSVAAELVLPKKEDLKDKLGDLNGSLKDSLLDIMGQFSQKLDDLLHRASVNTAHLWQLNSQTLDSLGKKLFLLNPANLIAEHSVKIKDLAWQIYVRMDHFWKLKGSVFSSLTERLSALSPLNILSRGYSITFKFPSGEIVKETRTINIGDTLRSRLHKGTVISEVREVKENG